MTVQRRGLLRVKIEIWPTVERTNRRGDVVRGADVDAEPFVTYGSVSALRSQRAEVPGQQEVDIVRIAFNAPIPGLDTTSRVRIGESLYDVVTPPSKRHGSRHVQHWTVDLRRRPV